MPTLSSKPQIWLFQILVLQSTTKKFSKMRAARAPAPRQFSLLQPIMQAEFIFEMNKEPNSSSTLISLLAPP